MRENRPSGSEGGEAETNRPSLPLSEGLSHAAARLISLGRSDMPKTTLRQAGTAGTVWPPAQNDDPNILYGRNARVDASAATPGGGTGPTIVMLAVIRESIAQRRETTPESRDETRVLRVCAGLARRTLAGRLTSSQSGICATTADARGTTIWSADLEFCQLFFLLGGSPVFVELRISRRFTTEPRRARRSPIGL